MESVASILETRHAAWADELACAVTARRIAGHPALRNAFIELHGPLGAGKTTFARYLLAALGVEGRVKSPTYTLMEPYRSDSGHGGFPIAHFDFYRFDDDQEWEDAGFRDVFAEPGLKLVEWPEKAEALLPRCDLRLTILPNEQNAARELRIEALSARGEELLT